MVRQKKLVGQTPMDFMLPATDWVAPTELPDLVGDGEDIAIDLETRDDGLGAGRGSSWFYRGGWVTGVIIANRRQSFYAPVRLPETECFDHDAVGRWLRHHIKKSRRRIFHNAQYDLGWMWAEWDIEPDFDIDDTMAQAFIIDENRLSYSLDSVCKSNDIEGKDEFMLRAAAEAYGYNPKSDMWKMPGRFQAKYAMQDGTATMALFDKQQGTIEAQKLEAAYRLEADIEPLCVRMRKRGVRVNTSRAEQHMEYFSRESREALRLLTENFNVNGRRHTWSVSDIRSSRFMAAVFEEHGLAYPRTEKGNESFSNEWMSKSDHQLPRLCARADQFNDAGEKFIGKYILDFTHMGRIHAEIHQFKDDTGGTRTTRFSYSDPPLQQIPSRDEEIGPRIREIFEPEKGEVWGAVDYSQQEFRLMVHFAHVCSMEGSDRPVKMYRDNPATDFHDMVVEITQLPRRRAKDVNFAKAFGAGPPKFALMTGMTLEEAKVAMREYDDRLPFVSRLAEFCQKRADSRGYIRMIDGARGRFERWEPRWLDREKLKKQLQEIREQGLPMPDLAACDIDEANRRRADPNHPWFGQRIKRAFTHKAMNTLIQGSAARQMKIAMRACMREGIIPVLQMHDELDLSVPTPDVAERVGELMREAVQLVIPVKTDIEYGVNWGRAAKRKQGGVVVHEPTWENAVRDMNSGDW